MRAIFILVLFFGISYGQTVQIDLPQKKLDLFTSYYNSFLKSINTEIKKLTSLEQPANKLSDPKNLSALISRYDKLLKKVATEKLIILTKYQEYSDSAVETLSNLGVSAEKIKEISSILKKAKDKLAESFDHLEDFLFYKKKELTFLKNSKFSVNKDKIIFSTKQDYNQHKKIITQAVQHLKEFNQYSDQFLKLHKKAVKKINELF